MEEWKRQKEEICAFSKWKWATATVAIATIISFSALVEQIMQMEATTAKAIAIVYYYHSYLCFCNHQSSKAAMNTLCTWQIFNA